VKNIPSDANAIIMEYSDRDWPPMDNGGHGKIGYRILPGVRRITIPPIPGHTFELPVGFFLVKEHQGASWDRAGAYMPPCSGGRGNAYYVTVKAVVGNPAQEKDFRLLGKGALELGRY
jgi:hypothetical protein